MSIPKHIERIIQEKKTNIQHIDIANFGLSNEDVEELVGLLKDNPYINSINLSGNNIGIKGAESLSTLSVDKLDLSDNKIGNQGMGKFIFSKIKIIHLERNGITEDAYQKISQSLPIIDFGMPEELQLIDKAINFHPYYLQKKMQAEKPSQETLEIDATYQATPYLPLCSI